MGFDILCAVTEPVAYLTYKHVLKRFLQRGLTDDIYVLERSLWQRDRGWLRHHRPRDRGKREGYKMLQEMVKIDNKEALIIKLEVERTREKCELLKGVGSWKLWLNGTSGYGIGGIVDDA